MLIMVSRWVFSELGVLDHGAGGERERVQSLLRHRV
jgi:hypothetical protein